MPTFVHQGLRLFYRDEGQGLPVLLLHGFPLNGTMFDPQLAELSRSYRFIVPDHRGFGQSEDAPGPLEMSTLADDALALLDHLGLDSAVVGGVSMGGYASMALTRAAPSRVRALVLIDTQVGADDDAGKARRETTARNIEQQGVEFLVETMLPQLLAPNASEAVRDHVRAMIRRTPATTAASASRGMALRPDSREILSRFAGPALVVVGELDNPTPPQKARAMAELIGGAELSVIAGAGHLSNLEAPEAFNRELDRFLRRLTETGRRAG